jgi:hypothetical protein
LFGGWSRALPTLEGFYWYREEGSKPEVIFWEHDMQWVRTAGSDIPMGADMTHKIEGEFWSEMLNPPNTKDQPPR